MKEIELVQHLINRVEPLYYGRKSETELNAITGEARFTTKRLFGESSKYLDSLYEIRSSFPDWQPPLSVDELHAWEEIWNSCKNKMLELFNAMLEELKQK